MIGDISCDIDGSIQATQKATKPDNPVYVYAPENDAVADGYEGHGPVVMAVDNLPCELPKESSMEFGKVLTGFIPSMLRTDFSKPFDELELIPEMKRALILHNGKFTPDFKYMEEYL